MEQPDPADLRISDGDREQVAEVLRQAAGDGRIDLEELDERLEATYAAKTYRDLVPITLDLPTGRELTVPEHAALAPRASGTDAPATHHGSFAMMSETKRRGVWHVGDHHTASAVMGSVVLDLRQATMPREVILYCNAVMGGVDVIVDERTVVRVEGVGIMGSFAESRSGVEPQIDAGSPVVRVRGVALMGSVEVKRRGPSRRTPRIARG